MPKPFGEKTKEGFEKLLTKLKIKKTLNDEQPVQKETKKSCCSQNKFESNRFRAESLFDHFITALGVENFKRYTTEKDRSIVMFHHYLDEETRASIRKYNDASMKTVRPNHGYAYVDCRRDYQLCTDLGVKQTPMYKVYSRGALKKTIIEEPSLTSDNIKEIVEDTPFPLVLDKLTKV